MKKFYVKADVVITDEKIYNGEGKCYIEGVGLEEVANYLSSKPGVDYFKNNMTFECFDVEENNKKLINILSYEIGEADYE